MIQDADGRREQLIEELEEARLSLTAAAVLVAFAAVMLATVPFAVLVSGARLDWLPPALTGLAAILTGTKVVVALWGVASVGIPSALHVDYSAISRHLVVLFVVLAVATHCSP